MKSFVLWRYHYFTVTDWWYFYFIFQTKTETEDKSEETKTEEEEKTDENGAEKEDDSNQNANTGLCRYTFIKNHYVCLVCKIMSNSCDIFFVNGFSLLQPVLNFF